MLKIKAYYQKKEDLQKLEGPYKSMINVFDRFYLKPPKGSNKNASLRFSNTLAISCIRTLAEDLTENKNAFVHQMKNLWVNLLNQKQIFSNYFDSYAVPYPFYLGIIFGGVYYVLSKQAEVDKEKLQMMDEFVSGNADALPFFNVYKEELKNAEPTLQSDVENMKFDSVNNENISDLKQQIRKLIKENKELKDKIEASNTKEEKGLTAQQAAIFITTICHNLGGLPQNGRENLYPLLQFIFGFTENTSKQALRRKITEDSASSLACNFEEISPKIANLILDMPRFLEESKHDHLIQLRANRVKKN